MHGRQTRVKQNRRYCWDEELSLPQQWQKENIFIGIRNRLCNGLTDQQIHLTPTTKRNKKNMIEEWHLKLIHPGATLLRAAVNQIPSISMRALKEMKILFYLECLIKKAKNFRVNPSNRNTTQVLKLFRVNVLLFPPATFGGRSYFIGIHWRLHSQIWHSLFSSQIQVHDAKEQCMANPLGSTGTYLCSSRIGRAVEHKSHIQSVLERVRE